MPRYTTRKPTRAVFVDNEIEGWGVGSPSVPSISVEVSEGAYTGVLDKDGNEFIRHQDPIGYVHFETASTPAASAK